MQKNGYVKNPSRLITFSTATSGTYPYEGYFYVMDPAYWSNTVSYNPDSMDYGRVHARWWGHAVTAQVDGHVETPQFKELEAELDRWKNVVN